MELLTGVTEELRLLMEISSNKQKDHKGRAYLGSADGSTYYSGLIHTVATKSGRQGSAN